MAGGKNYKIDMCHGPLFSRIILFSLPLMATNILQLMFHAADLVVVGRYASAEAMAAVGATSSLSVLILNIFFGLAAGVNVLVARYIGAKDNKNLSKTVHTAMAVAIYLGAAMAIVGLFVSKPILQLMATPENILDKSVLYMWIYSLGLPFVVIYNFGSAILRAAGDTSRPLYYMLIAGIINVLLNLFFVLVCKWDVAGVAVATKLSNVVSAVLIWRALSSSSGHDRLDWHKIKLHWSSLWDMMKIGLPAGIQGSLFSISNITIQSSVNSLGWQAVAGNTAAQSLEGMVYVGSSSFYYAVMSFTGQNHGAKKYDRIIKSICYCLLSSCAFTITLGSIVYMFGRQLLHFYNPDPQVIIWGMLRLKILLASYFLCGCMDTINGALRGLGHSLKPMIVTLLGVCVMRIFWVMVIFPLDRTMNNLMLSYPVTWIITASVNGLILFAVCRKMMRSPRPAFN